MTNQDTEFGSQGGLEGQLRHPLAVCVDASGNVYVADSGNNRIQVYAPVP